MPNLKRSGRVTFHHHGTAQVSINPTTLAVTTRRHLPFGENRTVAAIWPNEHGYIGGITDPTGLTHLGAREYDPGIGRFISVDPLLDAADPQQWNAYSYANNSPVIGSDPGGLKPCDVGDNCAQSTYKSNNASQPTYAKKKTYKYIASGPDSFVDGLGVGAYNFVENSISILSLPQNYFDAADKYSEAYHSGQISGWEWAKGWGTFNLQLACAPGICGLVDTTTHIGGLVGDLFTGNAGQQGAAAGELGLMALTASLANKVKLPTCKHSFAPGTAVLLATGTIRPIELIQVGDLVATTDPTTGETTAEEVTAVHINQDTDLTNVTVTSDDGTTAVLHTTQHHPFGTPQTTPG